VLRLVSVEKDGLPNLSISGQSGSVTQDPDMPLEF